MANCGIVYAATRNERYVAEAMLSARSAKDHLPDMPITLFTDLIDSVFAADDAFDTVLPVDPGEDFSSGGAAGAWASGQLDRIVSLPRSPYERTLHLDSDTRVMSPDVREVFSTLDSSDIALVECHVDNSVSRRSYGARMFNVGFILYKRTPTIARLLAAWAELSAAYFQAASDGDLEVASVAHIENPERRRELLFMDQISLVQILSPETNLFGVQLSTLDESWNYRGSAPDRPLEQALKISHHPSLRNQLVPDLVALARRYEREGHAARAAAITSRLPFVLPDTTTLRLQGDAV